MPFVGDKGGPRFPEINRAKLIDGEEYAQSKGRKPELPQRQSEPDAERGRRHTGAGRRQAYTFSGEAGEDGKRAGEKREGWGRSGQMDLSTVNSYGFASRSQFFFPEAYKPLDTKFWKPLSAEEHADIHLRQAQANLKASFTDEKMMPVAQTEADEHYADATTRRNQSLRRRRKPMNYDERKRDEEIQRKLPLTRKYTTGESAFRESSSIVQTGPLDTPVLISGLPAKQKNGDTGPAPGRLKRRRRTRRTQPEPEAQAPPPEVALPEFNPNAAPKVKLAGRGSNSFGLRSRSEMMYPEAYRELSSVYWRKLSDEDRGKVMTVQARAMEKVGYERGTEKQFIEEIEPSDDYVVTQGGRRDDTERTGSGITMEGVVVFLVILAVLALAGYGVWRNFGDLVQ